jgi:hypothetical protein
MVRRSAWQVYFRGIPVELIPEAVAQAEARGADFASPTSNLQSPPAAIESAPQRGIETAAQKAVDEK